MPAAVLLELLLARDRRFLRVLAAWALPLAALFGALVLATGGGAWRHLVTWTALADYEWERMAVAYVQLAVIAAPLLALIAAALVAAPRQLLAGPGRLVFLYFALNLAAFATIAKAGAAQNYFIEPWLATLLLAALALRALGRRSPALRAGGRPCCSPPPPSRTTPTRRSTACRRRCAARKTRATSWR